MKTAAIFGAAYAEILVFLHSIKAQIHVCTPATTHKHTDTRTYILNNYTHLSHYGKKYICKRY